MMNILNDTAILIAPSYRSRAYAQALVASGLIPKIVVVLPGDEPVWDGPDQMMVQVADGKGKSFKPSVPAVETLSAYAPNVVYSPVTDVNSPKFIEVIKGLDAETVIYSGLGGVLLKKPLLDAGKRFLHVHGGYAPQYRGSTAFYYSLLKEGSVGATAIWLVKEIDAGPILLRRKYSPPMQVEVDRILDPLVRADVLVDVLSERLHTGSYPDGVIENDEAETYHVIHPVLKSIALDSLGLVGPS